VKCDFGFSPVSCMERALRAVLDERSTDPIHHELIAGILEALPVHGGALIEGWQRRARSYPEPLAHAMIEKHMKLVPRWVIEEMCVRRGDLPFLYECLLESQRRILALLAAVNRIYRPAKLKGAMHLVPRFEHAPERTLERLNALLSTPPERVPEPYTRLAEDCFEVVAKREPAVDLEPAREHFALAFSHGPAPRL